MVRLPKSASLERACERNDRCGVSVLVPFSFQSLSICSWESAVLSQPLTVSALLIALSFFGNPSVLWIHGR